MWGNLHVVSDTALSGILGALGVPTASTEDAESAIQGHQLAEWTRPFRTTEVVYEDLEAIRLRVPEELAGSSVKLEIEWEDGELQHHPYWLPELEELERATVAGVTYVAKRLPLPQPLRLGYHTMRVHWVREPELEQFGQARLIVCPRRVHEIEHRIAGLAISLYGLRSARNWGCGDFTDLRAAVSRLAPAGVAFLALNPLHAIPNRQPFNISPYLPECSLYRNYLYLDVERVPGHEDGDGDAREAAELRATEFVEYERVAALKLKALRAAFERFRVPGSFTAERTRFAAYVDREGEPLQDFALYQALWWHLHQQHPDLWLWTDWPEPYRNARSKAAAGFADERHEAVLFSKFLQWQIDEQIAEVQAHAIAQGMQIGLYHDLALATDRFGADLWAFRCFYATGARVGAPPDDLAPGGQDWGFPPPNREAHREDGYEHFIRLIRNTARHGGALRIDHVMRFFRLYWIPDGVPANEGTFVRDYCEDLLGIIALESVRGRFLVIGEDLGTVEPEIRQRLAEAGILGYKLLWYERHPDGRLRAPREYPERAAVSTTTHDLPTLAGFFHGRDIEARFSAGLIDDATHTRQWAERRTDIHRIEQALAEAGFPNNAVGFTLSTPSTVAIVNQEDLTGETEQQNVPATTWEHPNWRRKMKVAVEDLDPFAAILAEHIRASDRR